MSADSMYVAESNIGRNYMLHGTQSWNLTDALEIAPHDIVARSDDDADATLGAAEVDYSLQNLIDAATGGIQADDDNTETLAPIPPPVAAPLTMQDSIPGTIDPALAPDDMLMLIYAEIQRKKLVGHHIESMNTFNQVGIKQIVTKVFLIEGRQKNLRDETDEDKEIAEIAYKVEFTDINLTPPTTVKYKSGSVQMLTPGMARTKNLTYSAQMYVSLKITATAYFKNGATRERVAEIDNHRIASIPCAVGTELCNTFNQSKAALKEMEEDPYFPGGTFIIKGFEWAVDNLENITNNIFHVYKNAYLNELVRGTFLSKPGDAFENSYQIVLRYLNSGAITIAITTNKDTKFEIPYYLILRCLGMTRDRDIVNNIVYGVGNGDPVTRKLEEILERAFEVDDAKFDPVRKSTDPTEIVGFLAKHIMEQANTAAARKDDNVAKYLNSTVMNILDRFLVPHIGTQISHRPRKGKFICHLVNRLLCVFLEVVEPADRDSLKYRRQLPVGPCIAKSFKTDFNFAIVQEIKKQLRRDFGSTPFKDLQLEESVKTAMNSDDLERMLTQAITTGNKTIIVKRNEVINRISSSMLYHKNDLNVKSTLNNINTPNSTASKQTERADEMRRVHPTFLGYIDPSQSHDTGEHVGRTKQLCCMASIVGASSSFVLKNTLAADTDIIPLDIVRPEQITSEQLAKVFVNGDWVGCCKRSWELARKYRLARRTGAIHHFTTIFWEVMLREVYMWTDLGRLVRPLVIVYNNIETYMRTWREKGAAAAVKFQQWIKLTREHIVGLRAGKIGMDDLRREQVIEYISPEEQENTYIARNVEVLRNHAGDITHMFTHMDIDQALLGIVTLACPQANHSGPNRNTLYTNHRKQSIGWFALNYPFRIDKGTALQWYCERPLISSFTDSLCYPNGQNTIVALMLHTGRNCEDSIIVNQASVDCGAFNASHYNYEKTELEQGEQFGNPDIARTIDNKKNAIYEHIVNGFVKEGTLVDKGHALIIKTSKIPKPIDQYLYVDKSIIYKSDEPRRVERVVVTQNDSNEWMAKVKLRADRPLRVGDKLASRMGNKGIVAAMDPRCDMPYCEDGTIPDLLVNAHSVPTRMAINQIGECVMAQLASRRGCLIDSTPFKKINMRAMLAELESYGVKYGGHKRMYNGRTGEWIDTLIFIGPTTYQRLLKFVVDENYAMRTGPTSAMTRQPLEGRPHDGGLRLGEMEAWVFCGHGTMRALNSKIYDDSDGIDIHICRICGNRAVVNEKKGIYKCKHCGDAADIATVASSWVGNLFFNEASAMNIKMQFGLEPYTYDKAE